MDSFHALRQRMVEALYDFCMRQPSESEFLEEDAYDIMRGEVGAPIVRVLLHDMSSKRLIVQTRANPVMYAITRAFVEEANELHRTRNPDTSPSLATTVPASNRFVELNHNSASYREMTAAVDHVIAQIAGDNEYGATAPEEKEQLLTVLGAGRRLLDAVRARASAVDALLISALRFVAENAAKAIIGAAAIAAATLVAKHFGLI